MIPNLPDHPRIELVRPSALKEDPRNARTHSDKQIAQIAASIERFGFAVPIVVDGDNKIAAGHGRWRASQLIKLDLVPVIRVAFLTDEDRRAFALAENRIAQLSGWDDKLLAEELQTLFDGGYDLEITGFTTADLDFSLPEPEARGEPEKVELPDPSARAISRVGDLWLMGPHRIYCGDARDIASYETLMNAERAAIVTSDPPYNVPVVGHISKNDHRSRREFAMASGEMSGAEYTTFLRDIFRACSRFSRSGSIHYICMDWRHIREILDAADGVYDQFKQLLVWVKDNGGQGSFYRSQHELVFVFKAGKGRHKNHFGLGATGRYRTNVVRYAGANSFRKGRARDLTDHCTVKPTAMFADFLLDCSDRGDIVLDPFLGSGTTLLAAHKVHRQGCGIEIDPLYVDTAICRLNEASGLVAVLAGDGRTFAEIDTVRKLEAAHGG